MQTIKRETYQQPIDNKMSRLLLKPFQDIDLPFLRDAVEYLRLTVDSEISRAVSSLGSTAIDLAGTGGSGIVKFNTSTAASFVVAAHGVDVIKFGNRSITGNSGSLDFLSALGCSKDATVSNMESVFKSTNLLFLSAPTCYPNLASIREQRKQIGKPTIFNFIGPLLNPARPAYRLFGISNSYMHLLINQFIKTDGTTKRAITAHASIRSGYSTIEIDELLPFTPNTATLIEQSIGGDYPATVRILDIPQNKIHHYTSSSPTALSISNVDLQLMSRLSITQTQTQETRNSDSHPSDVNARIFTDIVGGNDTTSSHYHGIVLNAGAAFFSAGAVGSLAEGISTARKLLSNKSVSRKLQQVRRVMS